MKKMIFLGLSGLAVLAMTIAPVIACDGSKEASTTSAQTTSSKATCGAKAEGTSASLVGASCGDKATSTTASAHGTCNFNGQKLTAEECAKMMASMTPEQCAKACGYEGKMEMVNMNIKGMTCGGCESSVTTALEKTPGVVKVVSVNYKDGSALVCIDPAKTKAETLTQTVSNKGYEAQIIPAVATTGTTGMTGTCAKTCSPEAKAACAAKETTAKTGAEGSK